MNLEHVTIEQAPWSGRAKAALSRTDRFKTLAQLDKAKDTTLLSIPRMGQKNLSEIRETIKSLKDKTEPPVLEVETLSIDQTALEWAYNHQTAIQALIRGELVLTPK